MPRSVATATMASFASLTLRAIVPGKPLFLVPLRASAARTGAGAARGWTEKGGERGWNTNGIESRTNGPCSRQKSYVRPIHPKRLCASGYSYFNANKRNGTVETLAEEDRYTPALGQVTGSRVPFKAAPRSLLSILSSLSPHIAPRGETARSITVLDQRRTRLKNLPFNGQAYRAWISV